MARDKKTGKTVGLKILDPEKMRRVRGALQGAEKAARRARSRKQIVHPRIVETFEYGSTKDGKQYLVMEFVEGQGLHAVLKNQNAISTASG